MAQDGRLNIDAFAAGPARPGSASGDAAGLLEPCRRCTRVPPVALTPNGHRPRPCSTIWPGRSMKRCSELCWCWWRWLSCCCRVSRTPVDPTPSTMLALAGAVVAALRLRAGYRDRAGVHAGAVSSPRPPDDAAGDFSPRAVLRNYAACSRYRQRHVLLTTVAVAAFAALLRSPACCRRRCIASAR